MPAPLALIEDGKTDGTRVLALHGELDVGTTAALREWLDRASESGRRSLTVDLTNVEFMAVSGVYALCDEQARMARHHARMTIVCASRRILQLFDVCRLDGALLVVERRDSVAGGGWDGDDNRRAERLGAWLNRYARRPSYSTPAK